MAEKKIIDVTSPNKVTPSSSGRPIIVTNRSVLSGDPMVVPAADTGKPTAAEPVARTAKTIKPVNEDVKPADEEKADAPAKSSSAETAETPEKASEAESEAPESTSDDSSQDTPADQPAQRDNEAAATAAEAAEEAARQAREAELEQLISSGKYAVPVNSADRKRTEHASIALTIFVVLLSLLLIDLMLDANIIELLQKLPHTHFFTAK